MGFSEQSAENKEHLTPNEGEWPNCRTSTIKSFRTIEAAQNNAGIDEGWAFLVRCWMFRVKIARM